MTMVLAPPVGNQLTSCLDLCVGHFGSFSLWLQVRTAVVDKSLQVRATPHPSLTELLLTRLGHTPQSFSPPAYRCAVIGRAGLRCLVSHSLPVPTAVDILNQTKAAAPWRRLLIGWSFLGVCQRRHSLGLLACRSFASAT